MEDCLTYMVVVFSVLQVALGVQRTMGHHRGRPDLHNDHILCDVRGATAEPRLYVHMCWAASVATSVARQRRPDARFGTASCEKKGNIGN